MIKSSTKRTEIVVIGHPNAQIGMGTHIRSVFRSMLAARLKVKILNAYGSKDQNSDFEDEFSNFNTTVPGRGINIFCINGDEVRPILSHLGAIDHTNRSCFNIIYPMWELPRYPKEWALELERFDEVWAPSKFVHDALRKELGNKVYHLPIACEVASPPQRTRRYFKIPEAPFAFLTSFDFLSYLERKNPMAVLNAFVRAREIAPQKNMILVVKIQNGLHKPQDYNEFMYAASKLEDSIVIIDETLSTKDTLALVGLCDAYVSLHRSEGFGLGIAESMCLGRPTICTPWSGNMDFCGPSTNQLVDYTLIKVKDGQYPHWQDQVWASADINDAANRMIEVCQQPEIYKRLSFNGRVRMARDFSFLATGLRYADRISVLESSRGEILT